MRMFFLSLLGLLLLSCSSRDYRTADRSSSRLAELPSEKPEALVQIYTARAFGWRGFFAVHSWIATKEKNATDYYVYHVIGWRLQENDSSVVIEKDIPDRRWFDAEPEIIFELQGASAEKIIPKIQSLAKEYPHADTYRAWPGPNSNTFVSYIIRRIPELGVELPPHAIGKDFLVEGDLVSRSETRTGGQISFFGVLGLTAGLGDGLETNLLGLNLGVDFLRPALKLPLIGRIGLKDKPVFSSQPDDFETN